MSQSCEGGHILSGNLTALSGYRTPVRQALDKAKRNSTNEPRTSLLLNFDTLCSAYFRRAKANNSNCYRIGRRGVIGGGGEHVLLILNPSGPHDASKHYLASLKDDLISLKLEVLEQFFIDVVNNNLLFFHWSPISSHLHSLQVENCDSNSRRVVDEDDNG